MNKKTLAKQLTALIGDFGYDNVRKTLGEVRRARKRAVKPNKLAINRVARPKPNAVAVVASLDCDESEKRDFLSHLAKKYDAKEFMPGVGHVRMFLENENSFIPSGSSNIKSRQQVTVKVFKKLAEMSLQELRDLEFYGAYDPPKRLATYAEAIENFGRHLRDSR